MLFELSFRILILYFVSYFQLGLVLFVFCRVTLFLILSFVCLLLLRQTGAGKSFTMEGVPDPPELRGIIPNSFKHIFDKISVEEKQYLVRASYLEIYNEEIRDLLSKDPKNRLDLKVQNRYPSNRFPMFLPPIPRLPFELFVDSPPPPPPPFRPAGKC